MDQTEIAKSVLVEGETLLWSGAPDRLRRVTSMSRRNVMWMCLAVLYLCTSDHLLMRLVWGSVLALLIAFPIAALRKNDRVLYGITNRRVFMILNGRPETLVSFYAINPDDFELHGLRSDGSGTLVIKKMPNVKTGNTWKSVKVEFIGIADVHGVVRILKDTFPAKLAVR